MEIIIFICGICFIFFLAWVLLEGDNMTVTPQSVLDDMAEEQMKEDGLDQETIDEILRRH